MRVFTFFLILSASSYVGAQTKAKAELVDEFRRIQCDELLARVDNFHNQLQSDTTSRGLVIVFAHEKSTIPRVIFEMRISSASERHEASRSRVDYVHALDTAEPMVQFWIVPSGATEPAITKIPIDLKIPDGTKPFPFWISSDGICDYPTLDRYTKKILDANP